MEPRQRLCEHLKRTGPTSIRDLMAALALSENAVRHHLQALEREGFVRPVQDQPGEGAGRPARLYGLTEVAETLFPKYYAQLLELVLAEAEAQALLEPLVGSVVKRLADQIRPQLENLDPEERILVAARRLNLGGSLSDLERTPGGWELRAYNCPYLAAGCRFEAVCDIAPRVLTLATGLPAERVACQRDGKPACHLTVTIGLT
ncbi:ArsR family transcriptional regulator (plasmid) [Deinococcus metallilatus]|uniref:ArsR family transcriptional regulator n=2 Tax=Deinococcus metallilatus TaxID=1211322 RepID=A0AAJ5F7Q4_9DEIO|nr:ArsR family transcriptional regulator [Deinococcus metallilatus]QBY06882.1 ArsR family transcriptional regulator [Deinococcus metallilatus]TLK32271.1 ArsR family transcriptional regulator [Deinococcus metallilatus]